MAVKAFYGLGARTFGNPDGAVTGGGAYAAGGNNPNGPNQGGGAAIEGNFVTSPDGHNWTVASADAAPIFNTLALGASGYVVPVQSAHDTIQRAASLAALGSAPLASLSVGLQFVTIVFARGAFYLASDDFGAVATSNDAVTWVLGTNPGANPLERNHPAPYVVYDDVNARLIAITDVGALTTHVITAPIPAPGNPVVFTDQGAVGGGGLKVLGVQPGAGIALAMDGGFNIWKSTDGGATWAQIATDIFGGTAVNVAGVMFGQAHWLACAQVNTGLPGVVQSADGGVTWVDVSPVGIDPAGFPVLGTDGAGKWVLLCNFGPSATNYAASADDGSTWTVPGLYSSNGTALSVVLWDGARFVACLAPL